MVVPHARLVAIARNEANEFSLTGAMRIGPRYDRMMRGIRAFLSPTWPIRTKITAAATSDADGPSSSKDEI